MPLSPSHRRYGLHSLTLGRDQINYSVADLIKGQLFETPANYSCLRQITEKDDAELPIVQANIGTPHKFLRLAGRLFKQVAMRHLIKRPRLSHAPGIPGGDNKAVTRQMCIPGK